MESNFQGFCPLCAKPVRSDEDSLLVEKEDQKEIYHSACLHIHAAQIGDYQLAAPNTVPTLQEWIISRSLEWSVRGEVLQELRDQLGCSLTQHAKAMGISVSRLKRFEAGQPVKDAKLLHNTYILAICNENMKRQYNWLHQQVYGCVAYPDTKGQTFLQ